MKTRGKPPKNVGERVTIASGGSDASKPSDFAVARSFYAGRVVALGHDGVLGSPHLLDNQQFLLNLFEFLDRSGSKRVRYSTGHREWVHARYLLPLQPMLEANGYDFGPADCPLTKESLDGCRVLILGNAWGAFLTSEIDEVEAFCRAGGGVLLPGLGWSWCQQHPHDTMEDYPMMKMAAPFGVKWLRGTINDPTNQFQGTPILRVHLPPDGRK